MAAVTLPRAEPGPLTAEGLTVGAGQLLYTRSRAEGYRHEQWSEPDGVIVIAIQREDGGQITLVADEASMKPEADQDRAKFAADGPRDTQGRSLRQLDLTKRLMRYPCSYMIYSDAFDGLPDAAKDAVYARLWAVLSGKDKAPKYSKLSRDDRAAVVRILLDTKPELPKYFRAL